MIYYVPLETLRGRYTAMMNHAFSRLHPRVLPIGVSQSDLSDTITKGQFLDIYNTCIFKARQLEILAKMFQLNMILNGDSFIFADLFYPGIDMVGYMAELSDIQISIYGFNYAGRSDSTDYIQKLKPWSDRSEEGYHLLAKQIFVGSEYHRWNVIKHFALPADKVKTTGLIWDIEWYRSFMPTFGPKKDFLVWPHRLCREKGFPEFLQFIKRSSIPVTVCSGNPIPESIKAEILTANPDVAIRDNLSKTEYLALMRQARWFLSTAHQETFGYCLQEAILYGCEILVPNRACYPEMVPQENLYDPYAPNWIDVVTNRLLNEKLVVPQGYTERWDGNVNWIMEAVEAK